MGTRLLKEYVKKAVEELRDINCGYFSIGDEIFYGKWKNKRGRIVDIAYDERGVPVVEIEPVPKGRKANVIIGLYKIWHSDIAQNI